MTRLLVRRLAAAALLIFLVLTVLFFLLHLAPGDPTRLLVSPEAPRAQYERLRQLYGLDRPLGEQYLAWLGSVLRWDWGRSFSGRPVGRILGEALPNTLLLAAAALLIDLALGLGFGIAAARRPGSLTDHATRTVSLVLYSVPVFWLGLVGILILSYQLGLLPASHMRSVGAAELPAGARLLDLLHHLILPAAVLGVSSAGATVRLLRASLLEAMGQDYIRTARAAGLPEHRVLLVHGLRNALVPLVQLFGVSLPALLNGSLVIEVVFAWPGVGRVIFNAIQARDYPLVLAATALSAALVVAGSLLADLLHAAVDPRVRRG